MVLRIYVANLRWINRKTNIFDPGLFGNRTAVGYMFVITTLYPPQLYHFDIIKSNLLMIDILNTFKPLYLLMHGILKHNIKNL